MKHSFNSVEIPQPTRRQYDYPKEKRKEFRSLTTISGSPRLCIRHLVTSLALACNPLSYSWDFCNERTQGKCSRASCSFSYVAVVRAYFGRCALHKCISACGVYKR